MVGLLLWKGLDFATEILTVHLDFLEPEALDNSGENSPLRVRIGPLSIRAKNIMFAEKGLRYISSFLIGLFPADFTELRIEQYRLTVSWSLVKFATAFMRGEESGEFAPKLTMRLVGVRAKVKGNAPDAWCKQKEVVEAGIESMNHFTANRLTDLLDKTAPTGDDSPPSRLNKLIDIIINVIDVEVVGLHVSWESVEHASAASCNRDAGQQPAPGSSSNKRSEHAADKSKGWVLGVRLKRFRLFKKCDHTEGPIITPRSMHVDELDLYYDADGTTIRNRGTTRDRLSQYSVEPQVVESTAAVPVGLFDDGSRHAPAALSRPATPAMREADHNSVLKVHKITGTVLFPDVMCGLLGIGRQPWGRSKLLGIYLEDMTGVVAQLEPNQLYGFLSQALPVVAMYGEYMDWYEETRVNWHKKAFAHPTVPRSHEELENYAKALGSPASSGEGVQKRNEDELKRLDKSMSLVQIMLTRMRARDMRNVPEWEVERPERVMTWAKWLLTYALDPFEGPLLNDLQPTESACDGELGAGIREMKEESGSDEEAPPESLAKGDDGVVGGAKTLTLEVDCPETQERLQNLLYYAAQVRRVESRCRTRSFSWEISHFIFRIKRCTTSFRRFKVVIFVDFLGGCSLF